MQSQHALFLVVNKSKWEDSRAAYDVQERSTPQVNHVALIYDPLWCMPCRWTARSNQPQCTVFHAQHLRNIAKAQCRSACIYLRGPFLLTLYSSYDVKSAAQCLINKWIWTQLSNHLQDPPTLLEISEFSGFKEVDFLCLISPTNRVTLRMSKFRQNYELQI